MAKVSCRMHHTYLFVYYLSSLNASGLCDSLRVLSCFSWAVTDDGRKGDRNMLPLNCNA